MERQRGTTNIELANAYVSVAESSPAISNRRRFWLRGYALGQVLKVSSEVRRAKGLTDKPKVRVYHEDSEVAEIVERIEGLSRSETIRGKHLREIGMGPEAADQVKTRLLPEPH